MGWWETEYMNTQLIIGDEPLDITNDMINKIVACYQNDLQRKPLLEEILAVTQFALKFHLEDYVSNGGDKELVEIRAKTKKKPKYQSYQEGDIFVVALEELRYGFGKVLKTLSPKILVGFFDIYTDEILRPQKLKDCPYILKLFCSDLGIKNWAWKIIGHTPVGIKEAQIPDFYWMDSLNPNNIKIIKDGQMEQAVEASQNDIQGLEPFALLGYQAAEYRLTEKLHKDGKLVGVK